jgi:hypothetical protein
MGAMRGYLARARTTRTLMVLDASSALPLGATPEIVSSVFRRRLRLSSASPAGPA